MQKKNDDNLVGPPTPPDRPPIRTSQIFNLIQDVWLRILPLCGIRGVLAIGQTCKQLRALACDKHVWLALMRDLERRLFLDIPPGTQLHALSTSTLMSLARRTVRGPRTWSPANGCLPTISRTHRVHPRIRLGPGILNGINEAKLLPGGKYILFSNWRNLECWNVAEDRLIWMHKSARKGANVLKFAADIVDSGNAAVVVVCQRTFGHALPRKNIVEIIRLDFVTETSQFLLLTYAPSTANDDAFTYPQICGDLVAVKMSSRDQTDLTLLIKLSTAEAMLLRPDPHDLTIIEGYLVLLTVDAWFGTVNLNILAEEALQQFWRPASVIQPIDSGLMREEEEIEEEAKGWTVMGDVPGLMSWTTEIPAVQSQRVSAHKCPMVDGGEYVVWVYVSSCHLGNLSDGLAFLSSIFKFRLTLPSGHSGEAVYPSLCPVVTTTSSNDRDWLAFEEISYTGHTVTWDDEQGVEERLRALAELQIWDQGDRKPVLWTEDRCGEYIHISTYSGALTYSTSRELVVNYYE